MHLGPTGWEVHSLIRGDGGEADGFCTPGTEDVVGNGVSGKESRVIGLEGRTGQGVHSLIRSDGGEADGFCTPGTEDVAGTE